MAKNLRWYHSRFGWRKLRVNRKYKDRLFRFIFQKKEDLLQLYNAVSGKDYTNPEDLEIITLEDVIFMKMKNDLSFMIANRLNLYEHQSTYSPNMPIRGLIYFSRQYEGLIAERKDNVYGSKLVKLPTPEYVIFYNGTKEQEDQEVLYLSDAYEAGRGSGCLECKAVMLNINRGHNKELMEKCSRLWEYSEFIAEVNDNLAKAYSLKKAIGKAMDSCIEKGILADILVKNQAEVLHMLLTEYNEEQHMRDTYKEGYEEGKQAGLQAGYSKGEQAGLQVGYSKGEQAGYSRGQHELLEQIKLEYSKGRSLESITSELEEKIKRK